MDTHAEVYVAAVVDQVGQVLGTEAFAASAVGYQAALTWMCSHGQLEAVGWRALAAMALAWPDTSGARVWRWWR